MYIPQTGWPQMMVDPMQQMYWQESYRANCELAVAMTKADIELRKKSLEAQIRENEHERMEKIRSDVRSARELQKKEVFIDLEGNLEIRKEMFGVDRSDHLKFRVLECCVVDCQVVNRPILMASFVLTDKMQKTLIIRIDDMDDRNVNKKFNQIGVRFGFSREKETFLRQLLLGKLLRTAEVRLLPFSFGWYREDTIWKFCFPGDLCYKEVEKNA